MAWSKDGEIHTYAGFIYIVHHDDDGKISLKPLPGQHRRASTKKYLRLALAEYKEEQHDDIREQCRREDIISLGGPSSGDSEPGQVPGEPPSSGLDPNDPPAGD